MTIARNPPGPPDGAAPTPSATVRAVTPSRGAAERQREDPAPEAVASGAEAPLTDPRSADEAWFDLAAASLAAAATAADEAAAGVAAVQRAGTTLVEEVHRIRDALATGQRVIERLRRRVEAESAAAAAARATAAALMLERNRLIEEHDAFLAAILEEEEEARRALQAQQAQTEARLATVEAQLAEARGELQRVRGDVSRPAPTSRRPGVLQDSSVPDDVGVLRAQVAALEARVATLTRERERAREMLLRLQAQRDEASRTALELKRSLTPPPGAVTPPRVEVERASAASGDRAAGKRSGPAGGEVAAPVPDAASSALARALAATHPQRRASEPPEPAGPSPAPGGPPGPGTPSARP